MSVMHMVTFKHPDGTSTQHVNVETEKLALVFGEADWEDITEAKVIASGGPISPTWARDHGRPVQP